MASVDRRLILGTAGMVAASVATYAWAWCSAPLSPGIASFALTFFLATGGLGFLGMCLSSILWFLGGDDRGDIDATSTEIARRRLRRDARTREAPREPPTPD